MPHRAYFPLLNERFDIKHVAKDYRLGSLPDPQVYELARKENRVLVTYNIRDFQELAKRSFDTGIIGISPNLTIEQVDKKLNALLTRLGKKQILGKFTILKW